MSSTEASLINNLVQKESQTRRWTNYTLMYLLISLSSMPFFIGNEFLFINFSFAVLIFVSRKLTLDKFIVTYTIIYLLIFLMQSIFFSVLEINIVIGYLIRIFYAYITIKLLGKNITKYYNSIMYFFSILSFVFYFPTLIAPEQVNSFLESIWNVVSNFQLNEPGRTHVIIYTFGEQYEEGGLVSSTVPRNSGPFWEPGGFGVFLILAIIFEIIEKKTLFTKKNYVFLVAIATTLSTGSFIVLFVLLILYLLYKRSFKNIVFLTLIMLVGVFIYFNSFFLTGKINKEVSQGRAVSLANAPRTRFVSAQLDWIDFINNPVLGRGRYAATRFDVKEDKTDRFITHRNNGTTNLLVEFGLFGFVIFFAYMYVSFKGYCLANGFKGSFAISLVVVVLFLGFSQMLFNKPFFIGLSFMFMAAGYSNKRKEKQENIIPVKIEPNNFA